MLTDSFPDSNGRRSPSPIFGIRHYSFLFTGWKGAESGNSGLILRSPLFVFWWQEIHAALLAMGAAYFLMKGMIECLIDCATRKKGEALTMCKSAQAATVGVSATTWSLISTFPSFCLTLMSRGRRWGRESFPLLTYHASREPSK